MPSAAAEFAQPDVCIGLTILAYSLEGIRKMDLEAVVQHLQAEMNQESGPPKQRPSSLLYASWVGEANGEICGDVEEDELVDTKDLFLNDAVSPYAYVVLIIDDLGEISCEVRAICLSFVRYG